MNESTMTKRFIQLHADDNVATALTALAAGEEVTIAVGNGVDSITLTEEIPFGHKFSLRTIPAGEPVMKYGESIGIASERIDPGRHVHTHNLESARGRGDRKNDG